MPDVGTWANLAAYVVCTGLGLEVAHRAYWRINSRVMRGSYRAAVRAIAGSTSASLPLVAVLLITVLFCGFVDRHSLTSLGLQISARSARLFTFGAAVSLISVTVLFVVCWKFGLFEVRRQDVSGERFPLFLGMTTDFLLASVFEEIMVRGYIFWVLQNTWGGGSAVLGSAVLFSAFHLIKHPKIPVIFTLNAFLFGLITGHVRLLTGTVWAPIGLHLGWNLAMGPIFGMPCSGRNYDSGLIRCSVRGPDWLTGGLYSPDAGLLGSATLVITTIAMLLCVPTY